MKPVFVKELSKLSLLYIQQLFVCSNEQLDSLLIELMSRKIIEEDGNFYKFTYVGFVYFNDTFIFVMPKFIDEHNFSSYYSVMVNLLKKYNEEENLDPEEIETFGDIGIENSFNLFKIIYFLLLDFQENGLYENEKFILGLNGEGEIDWNSTIEENTAYLNNGNFIYLDFYTQEVINAEEDFIRKVHMYVLKQCSDFLLGLEILDILGLPEIGFDIDFNELGDKEYILYKIELEKSNQFLDRKLMVLDAIYYIINKQNSFIGENKPYLFGTRSFEIVWEKVCAFVLKNEYEELKRSIPRPIWKDFNTLKETNKKTLRPDILRKSDKHQLFFVFDAKYYITTFNENGDLLNNFPGITDVSKQYLYEKLFAETLGKNDYNFYNVFLMPGDEENQLFGNVRFKLFEHLGPVFLLRLDAKKIFIMYSKRQQYEDSFIYNLSISLNQYNV